VAQVGQGGELAAEALQKAGLFGDLVGAQELEGPGLAVFHEIQNREDAAHTTPAELALDLVPAGDDPG